ncbi:MAG: alanine--tRNA ligase [Nitrospirales bacterium]|nr:alanine--tRNA ligase [Nitrospirales bacterium]
MISNSQDLRRAFVGYFVDRGHTAVPSAPLIPQADPSLLFTNAGMNQFKRVFLGEETKPYARAVSIQKCMRAGGKHNDLENVGFTRRHHTFFEMLGNFSFGDYFKEDAIAYGWEFLTKVAGLPPDRLWVTVFRDDDEAHELWSKRVGVPADRLVRLGEKDNFWQMGETGPCGPCSEILIDQGEAFGCGRTTCAVGCDCDRYLEIWNLVFMQYDRDASGNLRPLPKPSIDTGMGLERLAAVTQRVSSNYDSDIFRPLLTAIGQQCGQTYGTDLTSDRSMRVIADHVRAMTFLITDGVLPSNEGRGYVLRRIMRRASRHGRLLGVEHEFLFNVVPRVVVQMEPVYPELGQMGETVTEVVRVEEERFIGTLEQALPLLNQLLSETKRQGRTQVDGEAIFKLYDTYGFPMDLVEDAAREEGLTLDHAGYQQSLEVQRDRARKTAKFSSGEARSGLLTALEPFPQTQFVGYSMEQSEGTVLAMLKDEQLVKEAVQGEVVEFVLDSTPFFPEGGGQVGDHGTLVGPSSRIQVQDTVKAGKGWWLHKGQVLEGQVHVGDRVQASVAHALRQNAAKNHTATHLMHAALREVLGPHVKQQGSLVAPNRLRFDFTHFKGLTSRHVEDIENLVNAQIRHDTPVQTGEMAIQEALQRGALAFFGDKYGDQVRVVEIGEFSKELCGGTHCRHTGEIGLFRIASEGGVAAGVRRIEALTGEGAIRSAQEKDTEWRELASLLKAAPTEVLDKTKKLLVTLRETEKDLERAKQKILELEGTGSEAAIREIQGVPVLVQRIDGLTINELRTYSDKARHKVPAGLLVLGTVHEGKVSFLVIADKAVSAKVPAGKLAQHVAQVVGGSGGGRPEMAQAGGNQPENLKAALDSVYGYVASQLS